MTVCCGSPYIHKDVLEKFLGHRACAVKADMDGQDASEDDVQDDEKDEAAEKEDEAEKMDRHRARGHNPKDPNCPVCVLAPMRRRPHTRLNPRTQCGGELSIDLSGPHVACFIPGRRREQPTGRYLLVASYSPLRESETQSIFDAVGAKAEFLKRSGLPSEVAGVVVDASM